MAGAKASNKAFKKFVAPDFSAQGYRVDAELGANRAGGRVTYRATHLKSGRTVVLKQFQYARTSATWGDYDSLRQEIQVLRDLKHPGIPRYLGVFKASDGFCMVQEYKAAKSLAEPRSFSPQEVRKIAIAALEILVYLQNRIPSVIHRDFKPANLLVDKDCKVYLVDFGFARIGDGEVGVSSVVKGTLGFMPPEQIFNRQLTEASDLYGLGMTLICLLTRTPADQVGTLVDVTYQVDFTKLKSDISRRWCQWLENMVAPRLSDRFASAAAALEAVPQHDLRQPEVRFSQSRLTLAARQRGEIITQTLTLTNGVPDTTLSGRWQVADHQSDPVDGDVHSWIRFVPETVDGNQTVTEICVDTSKLMTGERYQRTLLLKSNANQAVHSLDLELETAPIPIRSRGMPYAPLAGLLLVAWLGVWTAAALSPISSMVALAASLLLAGLFGSGVGLQLSAWLLREAGLELPSRAMILLGYGIIFLSMVGVTQNIPTVDIALLVVSSGFGMCVGSALGVMTGLAIERCLHQGFSHRFAIVLPLLIGLFGALLGLSYGLVVTGFWLQVGLTAVGLAIAAVLVYLPIQRSQAIALYRSAERRLIRP